MRLQLVRTLWGLDQPWEELFPKFQSEGFSAVEWVMPQPEDLPRWNDLLQQHGFGFIAMGSTYGATVGDHIQIFRQQIERARKDGASLYNCHSGSDLFSLADAKVYFDEVLKIEESVGIPVAHETHRKRLLFHPLQARDLLNAHPTLKICADFSHWVCVCGRLLEDCQDIIDLAASRTIHIHARVGYSDGPQVSDPRAPEYLTNVLAHEKWWDAIWDSQQARGMAVSTLNAEFGPANYMHLLPYTQQPVVDLWEVTKWMADRQAARFADRGL
jgi:hypothetical protein